MTSRRKKKVEIDKVMCLEHSTVKIWEDGTIVKVVSRKYSDKTVLVEDVDGIRARVKTKYLREI